MQYINEIAGYVHHLWRETLLITEGHFDIAVGIWMFCAIIPASFLMATYSDLVARKNLKRAQECIKVELFRNEVMWYIWLTLEEYFEANPSSKTSSGVRCHYGNSSYIRNRLFGGTPHRIVSCQTCNNALYRVS
jgi:hypothetical protein